MKEHEHVRSFRTFAPSSGWSHLCAHASACPEGVCVTFRAGAEGLGGLRAEWHRETAATAGSSLLAAEPDEPAF
eukprot:6176103-Pleurochrysis_carterae.AAC.2